jgi:hypothetical protein
MSSTDKTIIDEHDEIGSVRDRVIGQSLCSLTNSGSVISQVKDQWKLAREGWLDVMFPA